ncbi:MAG: response regulator [Desulfobacteraceae bacterium]|nr:response regulator [Desulfobacteraceae bacterium]
MIDIDNMAILIVDDMKSMRTIMRKLLSNLKLGKDIHFAENGMEGLRCLQSNRMDIVIVDWKMPVMTGSQMLDAIRADQQLRDMPVIMVTSEAEKDVVLDVAEIEVDAYLLKPVTPSLLDEKIRAVIDRVNNPDEATLHVRKSRAYQDAGNLERAIGHMEMAVKLKPNASRLVRNLGLLHIRAGKMMVAKKYLLKAASVNSQDAITRHYLAKLYWKTKNWTESVKYWCEVLFLTDKFNEDAILIGEKLLENRLNPHAINLFSKIVRKAGKKLPIREKILDSCMDAGEMEYSNQLVAGLMKEFPKNYDLVYKAGLIQEELGNDDKALEYFLTADKHQDSLDLKLKLAKLCILQKRVIQADTYLTQVLRMDPGNEDALSMRQTI